MASERVVRGYGDFDEISKVCNFVREDMAGRTRCLLSNIIISEDISTSGIITTRDKPFFAQSKCYGKRCLLYRIAKRLGVDDLEY